MQEHFGFLIFLTLCRKCSSSETGGKTSINMINITCVHENDRLAQFTEILLLEIQFGFLTVPELRDLPEVK